MPQAAPAASTKPDAVASASTQAAALDIRQSFSFEGSDFGAQVLRLARTSLEHYVRAGLPLSLPADVPRELGQRQACFVTLREHGRLRGCVGTIEASRTCLAEEIVENAIGAGMRDPRFLPVEASQLEDLAYSVDVLSPLEPAADLSVMDPAKYGMVVRQGTRVGVLLPGIPEILNAQQQLEVCCQKAGISSPQSVELFRFTVDRYAEPGAEH